MDSLYSVKTLGEVMQDLKALPYNPKPLGGRISTMLGLAPDLLPMLLDSRKKTAGHLYPYPRYFRSTVFPSLDGTPLSGKLALHGDGVARPGLVFCHGIFGSKNQTYVRNVAIKAFKDWDYNVLAMDLRSFGESQRMSKALMTHGWKEAEDIIGAARLLGSFSEVTTVGVCAYSLGGGSAIIAAAHDEGEYITGGVMAWSGFADERFMVAQGDETPLPWDPFFLTYPVFRTCLKLKNRDASEGGVRIRGLKELISYACNAYYHVPEEDLSDRSSPMNYVSEIRIPTVHVHAEDDPIIPVLEAEKNIHAAKDNPNFDVWILKRGGHCTFAMVDKVWYEQVLQSFFKVWAFRPYENGVSETPLMLVEPTGLEPVTSTMPR